jgi:hypothetical protein
MLLKNLLLKDMTTIAATSTLMKMGMTKLDCSGVEFLTEEQITALFSSIS